MMTKVDRVLTALEHGLLGAGLLAAALILFINVVLRYFFARGLVWAEEAVRYIIIWMVFVGGSAAARQANHINVDVLLNLLPPEARRRGFALVNLMAALFSLGLAAWGYQLAMVIRASGQITPGMQMPMWLAYLAVPAGAALMSLRFLQVACDRWQGGERP